jgi:capsular polysaccharide biosynthesis protein
MNSSELNFLKHIERIYQRWWILALAIMLGGILGGTIHFLKPPIYDAQAQFVVTLDYSRSGDLSPYNVDMAVGAIQPIFYSEEVLQYVVEQAHIQQLDISASEFYQAIGIERRNEIWLLRVRDSKPERAEILVDLWAQKGYQDLLEARSHALRVGALDAFFTAFRNCPSEPSPETALPSICFKVYAANWETLDDLQVEMQNELALSKGLNPNIIFSEPTTIPLSLQPVLYNRNWMIFAGMLAGFLMGILWINFPGLRVVKNHAS